MEFSSFGRPITTQASGVMNAHKTKTHFSNDNIISMKVILGTPAVVRVGCVVCDVFLWRVLQHFASVIC